MTGGAAYEAALNVLCPMHVIVQPCGRIRHVGPTIHKLRHRGTWIGSNFFDQFVMRRPNMADSIAQIRPMAGRKLHLALHDRPEQIFKGVLVPLPCGVEQMESLETDCLINLSFGISILNGVRTHRLSNADFAPTDLAVEMLYLMEAKSAAMAASRALNQKLEVAKIAAEEQAFTDTLTGLKNRRAMDHVLSRLIAGDKGFAVMQIDLDYFKAVNDSLGHAAGDHVLQTAARIMVEATRDIDTVARVGGDEFTLLLPGVAGSAHLAQVAERIITRLEQPIKFDGAACQISASIGSIGVKAGQDAVAEDVLSDADAALYRSKQAGRARHTVHDETVSDAMQKRREKPHALQ